MKTKIVTIFTFELVQVERLDNRKEQYNRSLGEPEMLRVTLYPVSPTSRENFLVDAPFTFTTSYFSEMGQFLLMSPIGTRFEINLSSMVPAYLPPGEDAFARGMKRLLEKYTHDEEEVPEEEPYRGPMYNA